MFQVSPQEYLISNLRIIQSLKVTNFIKLYISGSLDCFQAARMCVFIAT